MAEEPQITVKLSVDAVEAIAEVAASKVLEQLEASPTRGYLNVEAASEFLACSPSRIYSLVSARRIPFRKDGSRLLFIESELREYVEGGGAAAP